MTIKRLAAVVALATAFAATSAAAVPLSGLFNVNVNNFNAGGDGSNARAVGSNLWGEVDDFFRYDGALDFRVPNPDDTDTETIADFLATGGGTVIGLDPNVADDTLSTPTFQTTTIFSFKIAIPWDVMLTVTHDDGIRVLDDGVIVADSVNPTVEKVTGPFLMTKGEARFIYVAANGNPSIFEVDVSPVPLPVPAALLLAGIGAMGATRLRKKA